MPEFDTLWGAFSAEDDDEPKTPDAEKEEDDAAAEEVVVDEPKGDEEDKAPEEKQEDLEDQKKPDEKVDVETDEGIFESVNSILEEEELMFLGEDDQYEPTAEGLSKLVRDNMEKYKAKLEDEFKAKESEIHETYKNASTPKFSDMDTENQSQAEMMLKKYYAETGFEEEEIEEKLKELSDLDSVSKEAKIAKRYLSKKEAREAETAKKIEEADEAAKAKQIDEYINGIKNSIDSAEEMAGFKMTNKMKKDFKGYLFDKDKEGLTKAQKANNDPDRRLKLAFLDFVEFNKKDFEIKAKTEVSNELNKKTSRFTSKNATTKGKTVVKDEPEEQQGFGKGFLDFWSLG